MPAAMVLPIAAAMPNHMPRTCRSLPRPGGREATALEDESKVVDNEVLRGFLEAQSYWRTGKMQGTKSGGAIRDFIRV